MKYDVRPTSKFLRKLKQLVKKYSSLKEDVRKLGISLQENPFQGADLGNGLRKVRLAITSKGRGKSGGARVITLNAILSEDKGEVLLITIYDKSECSSISDKELRKLLADL